MVWCLEPLEKSPGYTNRGVQKFIPKGDPYRLSLAEPSAELNSQEGETL